MTREQISQTLEYKEPAKSIAKIHERNDMRCLFMNVAYAGAVSPRSGLSPAPLKTGRIIAMSARSFSLFLPPGLCGHRRP